MTIADHTIDLVVEATQPQRLDRWLTARVQDLSRSRIQKLIDGQWVTVNHRLCTDKKAMVRLGDVIQLTIPPSQPLALTPESIPLEILYEDDQLLIVNKPAGMVVHPAPGHASGTLVNAILAHCGNSFLGIGGVHRPGIVHRLDKDTTGAIVVAKTEIAHRQLQAQLQAKTARRDYLGVIYGVFEGDRGTINAPIGRHPVDRKKQAIVAVDQGGREAITHWQTEQRLGNFTLMRFRLQTGRTHQIRVHSAYQGHPLVGDPVYGPRRSIGVNLPGQALHAVRLELIHPVSGKPVVAIAPLPQHFQTLLTVLAHRCGCQPFQLALA